MIQEILLTSSALIGVLILTRRLFRGKVSNRLLYGAWLLVAIRLLVPVHFGALDFSVPGMTEQLQQISPQIQVMQQQAQTVLQNPVVGPSRQEVYDQVVEDYIQQGQNVTDSQIRQEIQQQVEKQTAPSLQTVLLILWLTGGLVMVGWMSYVNYTFLRRARQGAEELQGTGSRVPVYVSSNVSSPCLAGLISPAIFVTPACAEEEDSLRHVLAHELTHLRHRDHIWALVRCVCLCVYWFNPLVWVAAVLSKRDCELACDEGALETLGEEERIAYGKTLVDMVVQANGLHHVMETATAMSENRKQLTERVEFIVKKRKTYMIAAVGLVVAVALVCLLVFFGGSSWKWKMTPLLSELPAPAGEKWVQLDGDRVSDLMIGLPNMTLEDFRAYAQELKNAGFNDPHNWTESEDGEEISLRCKTTDDLFVWMIYRTKGNMVDRVRYTVILKITDLGKDIEKVMDAPAEPWGDNEYEKILPEPNVKAYSSDLNEGGGMYTTRLHFCKVQQAREYTRELQDAGFILCQEVKEQPFVGGYDFSAQNQDGYCVHLSMLLKPLSISSNAEEEKKMRSGRVTLYTPGSCDDHRWDAGNYREYIPQPADTNWLQEINTAGTALTRFVFPQMDYAAALRYVQTLTDAGYHVEQNLQQDAAAQTLRFVARQWVPKQDRNPVSYRLTEVELTYDPQQGCAVSVTLLDSCDEDKPAPEMYLTKLYSGVDQSVETPWSPGLIRELRYNFIPSRASEESTMLQAVVELMFYVGNDLYFGKLDGQGFLQDGAWQGTLEGKLFYGKFSSGMTVSFTAADLTENGQFVLNIVPDGKLEKTIAGPITFGADS